MDKSNIEVEIISLVRRERVQHTTYNNIIDLVEIKFNKKISRWFIYKHSRDIYTPEKEATSNIYDVISDEVVRLRLKKVKYVEIIEIIKKMYDIEISRGFIYSRAKKSKEGKEELTVDLYQAKTFKNPLKPRETNDGIDSSKGCECGGNTITDNARGEIICEQCGIVITSRIIDQGPEWRVFTSEDRDKRMRTGSPYSMSSFDKGLSTDFNPFGKDARGVPLSASNRSAFIRWHKWNNRNKMTDSSKRNYSTAFNELDKLCSQLHITKSTKEQAALIYRKVRTSKLAKGCSINGMITACLYASCRIKGIPLSQEEFFEKGPIKDLKELRMCYKRVIQLIPNVPTVTADNLVSKYCSKMELPQNVISVALKLIKASQEKGITVGKNPKGIAAAALYIVNKTNNLGYSQKQFSAACKVTEVTIRNRTNEMSRAFELNL